MLLCADKVHIAQVQKAKLHNTNWRKRQKAHYTGTLQCIAQGQKPVLHSVQEQGESHSVEKVHCARGRLGARSKRNQLAVVAAL